MKNRIQMSLVAIALGVTMPLTSIAAAQQSEVSFPASQTNAGTLARLISTLDSMRSDTLALVKLSADKMFVENPSLAALEARYPGAKQVYIDTMNPIILDQTDELYPKYIEDLAQLFRDGLTSAEIDKCIAFFSSPIGRKTLNSVDRNQRLGAVANDVAKSVGAEDKGVSSDALMKDKMATGMAAVKELSISELKELERFFMSPVGKKLTSLMQKKHAIDLKWTNVQPSPRIMARLESEMKPALIAHIAKTDPEAAKRMGN